MAGIVVVVIPRDALQAIPVATEGPPTATATLTSTPLPTATATVTPTPTPTPTPVFHQVEEGDTLLSIAVEYDLSVRALEEANQIGQDELLQIGQRLLIPAPTPVPAEGEQAPPTPTPTPRFYVVQEGDTLLGIATELELSLDSLLEANGLEEDSLLGVGQELLVPAPTPTPTPVAGEATPTPITLPTPDPSLRYDTPALLWPPGGARLRAAEGAVLLSWASVGILGEDEYYVVELWWTSEGREQRQGHWTRATSWRLPEGLRPQEATRFQWRVEVRRQTAVNPRGEPIGLAISGGEERSFTWLP